MIDIIPDPTGIVGVGIRRMRSQGTVWLPARIEVRVRRVGMMSMPTRYGVGCIGRCLTGYANAGIRYVNNGLIRMTRSFRVGTKTVPTLRPFLIKPVRRWFDGQ